MDSNSKKQTSYAGVYRPVIDDKNRITIPACWREDEPQDFIIVPEPQGQFLLIMSEEEFERALANAEAQVPSRDFRIFSRQFHARSQHGSSDKQGRVVLPDDACKELGLKGEIAFIGGRGRFELWNLQKWKRAHEEETPTYQHVANVIGL
ncbi:MAG TPA: hypothetical protein VK474_03240 [Chthoniobacterales bacterium]|nr:hypothetical protein [Chthoniobacterales bacterium]